MNSDTPKTDALENTAMFADRPKDPICGEALLHARKMERDLYEARREAEAVRKLCCTTRSFEGSQRKFPWENAPSHAPRP